GDLRRVLFVQLLLAGSDLLLVGGERLLRLLDTGFALAFERRGPGSELLFVGGEPGEKFLVLLRKRFQALQSGGDFLRGGRAIEDADKQLADQFAVVHLAGGQAGDRVIGTGDRRADSRSADERHHWSQLQS